MLTRSLHRVSDYSASASAPVPRKQGKKGGRQCESILRYGRETDDMPDGAHCIRLSDGRRLSFSEFGNGRGFPLFYLHNHASSRLEGSFFHDQAQRSGFRIIAADRPGIGFSDFKRSQDQTQFAFDLLELADSLNIGRFGIMAWAGGGPFALAASALYPDRVAFLLSLACTPAQAAMNGQPRSFSDDCVRRCSLALMELFIGLRHRFSDKEPLHYIRRLRDTLCYADRKALNDPRVLAILAEDAREALRQGYRGVAHDTGLCFRDWSFAIDDVRVPVHVWQGTADTVVPRRHGEYLANCLPDGTFHRVANRGHFFFLQCMEEIFATAAELARIRPPQYSPYRKAPSAARAAVRTADAETLPKVGRG